MPMLSGMLPKFCSTALPTRSFSAASLCGTPSTASEPANAISAARREIIVNHSILPIFFRELAPWIEHDPPEYLAGFELFVRAAQLR